jgi:hypothetical protein
MKPEGDAVEDPVEVRSTVQLKFLMQIGLPSSTKMLLEINCL